MMSVVLGDGSQSFVSATYDSCQPKMQFLSKEDMAAGAQRRQEVNKDGVPKWHVRVNVLPIGATEGQYIKISVASPTDPGDDFAMGDLVAFDQLSVGAGGFDNRPGFSWFYFARSVVRAPITASV